MRIFVEGVSGGARGIDNLGEKEFFCSWSGGKDSCLALHHAIQGGGVPKALLTVMEEGGEVSRSHGLPRSVLEEQSRLLGIPIIFRSATWNEYEAVFLQALGELKAAGIEAGVFGDIDVEDHREWVRRVGGSAGVRSLHPLWQRSRRGLLEEFIDLGFEAIVVVLRNDLLEESFLGRTIDRETVAEMERAGIDASGELGEYHTVVTGGPLFSSTIEPREVTREAREEYSFLRIRA